MAFIVSFNYMVECTLNLDFIFGALADPTRRDILKLVAKKQLSVGEISGHYKLTFAAVSKHLKVLEKAGLIVKHRQGKEQIARLSPETIKAASKHLRHYQAIWNERFDALGKLLKTETAKSKKTLILPNQIFI
jgi:DNA-binding transcriptional ArsR family regulator